MNTDDIFMIRGARVSFPHLFKRPIIRGEEGKCGATLMLDPKKHASDIAALQTHMKTLIRDNLRGAKLPSDKLCLRDGANTTRPEYDGYMVLSASNRGRPFVLTNDGRGVIEDEEKSSIYGGCRVDAKVRLWAQNNQYGKRINAELVAIKFAGDDEPLDGSYMPADEAISGFETDEDTDDFLAA